MYIVTIVFFFIVGIGLIIYGIMCDKDLNPWPLIIFAGMLMVGVGIIGLL